MTAYKQRHSGFTLMEMVIVVAIIGILAAIAIPSYQNSVDRTYRNEAQSALLGLASLMERRYTENNHYCDNATGAASAGCDAAQAVAGDDLGTPAFFSAVVPENATGTAVQYNITIATATTSTFTLQATPDNGMAGDECGIFEYSSSGARTQAKVDSADTIEDCW